MSYLRTLEHTLSLSLSPSVRLTRTAYSRRETEATQRNKHAGEVRSKLAEVKAGRVTGELKIEKLKKLKSERQNPGGWGSQNQKLSDIRDTNDRQDDDWYKEQKTKKDMKRQRQNHVC